MSIAAVIFLFAARPARASVCAPGIVVAGRSLIEFAAPASLPPTDGTVKGVDAGCYYGDPEDRPSDRIVTVDRIRGVSPRTAVRDGRFVYVAPGSLIATRAHPLHPFYAHFPADPPTCGTTRRRSIVVDYTNGELIGFGRRHGFRIATRTTIANRPPDTPILYGQRLRVMASMCGRTPVAERIAFVGPDATPDLYRRYVAHGGGGGLPAVAYVVIAFGALITFGLGGGIIAVSRALRRV